MEKKSLPIKTKIAAWWMIVLLPINIGLILGMRITFLGLISSLILMGLLSLPFIFAGVSLLERKKRSWKFSITILSVSILLAVFSMMRELSENGIISEYPILLILTAIFWIGIVFVPFFIPLILLLLDRKNFWKIAL
jgi:hypothetical protein